MTAQAQATPAAATRPPRPKTIVLLCQHFFPEMISTGIHMTELAVALTRLGWAISAVCAQPRLLVATNNARVPTQMTYQGIRIARSGALGSHDGLASRLLFAMTFSLTSIVQVLRVGRGARGVVLTTNPPFLGLAAWLISKMRFLPYALIVYDVYPEIAVRLGVVRAGSFLERLWEHLTRAVLNEAAAVIVIGRDMEPIIAAKMRPDRRERIRLIPNWSDDHVVAPMRPEENPFIQEHHLHGRFVVQYAGRMGRTHNLEPLVAAADLLRDEGIVFQFIGDGAKRSDLLTLCRVQGLSNVVFLPYQPMERLREMLAAADVSVVCLERQFTGLSVPSKTYGVMAAGRPILAFLDPESEIGRTIVENNCGVVLRDPTGTQVASIVRELKQNRARLERMGQNGRSAFLANYTLSLAAQRYDACLSAVL